MSVKEVGEIYRCNACANEVTVSKVGGGILVCCNQDMQKIGMSQEERVPKNLTDVDREGDSDGDGGNGGGNGP